MEMTFCGYQVQETRGRTSRHNASLWLPNGYLSFGYKMDSMKKLVVGLRRKDTPRNSMLDMNEIRPHGRFGVGLLTEHPVGLLIVAAVIFLALERLPPARPFFVGSLALGGIIGFFLWLRHR